MFTVHFAKFNKRQWNELLIINMFSADESATL